MNLSELLLLKRMALRPHVVLFWFTAGCADENTFSTASLGIVNLGAAVAPL